MPRLFDVNGIILSCQVLALDPPCGDDNSAYVSRIERADERTRTADLISLRVRGQRLLSVALACNRRISKRFSVPCIAHYCTVLRAG
jgi:hypothetical protein